MWGTHVEEEVFEFDLVEAGLELAFRVFHMPVTMVPHLRHALATLFDGSMVAGVIRLSLSDERWAEVEGARGYIRQAASSKNLALVESIVAARICTCALRLS